MPFDGALAPHFVKEEGNRWSDGGPEGTGALISFTKTMPLDHTLDRLPVYPRLLRGMARIAELGSILLLHAENPEIVARESPDRIYGVPGIAIGNDPS